MHNFFFLVKRLCFFFYLFFIFCLLDVESLINLIWSLNLVLKVLWNVCSYINDLDIIALIDFTILM